jgi:hypothetical protein
MQRDGQTTDLCLLPASSVSIMAHTQRWANCCCEAAGIVGCDLCAFPQSVSCFGKRSQAPAVDGWGPPWCCRQ